MEDRGQADQEGGDPGHRHFTGRIRYGIDAQLSGMLYAAVAHSPVFGGAVKSVDATKI